MIPTSIDGTDITGATIDGTDVTEITVDGDTVFSPQVSPVAQSNLVGWWPFENGGQDETASNGILGASGVADTRDLSFSILGGSGISFSNTGGVTDINAGGNTGCVTGSGDPAYVESAGDIFSGTVWSLSFWIEDAVSGSGRYVSFEYDEDPSFNLQSLNSGEFTLFGIPELTSVKFSGSFNDSFQHHVLTCDGFTFRFYLNGSLSDTESSIGYENNVDRRLELFYAPSRAAGGSNVTFDDVRFYDKELSSGEVSQIYQNTKP